MSRESYEQNLSTPWFCSRTIYTMIVACIAALSVAVFHTKLVAVHTELPRALVAGIGLGTIGVLAACRYIERGSLMLKSTDKPALFLLIAPTVLVSLLVTGCNVQQAKDSWGSMNPLQKATVTVEAMQQSVLLAQNMYMKTYDAADTATRVKLQSQVAPVIDNARKSVVALSDVVIIWHDTGKMPPDVPVIQLEAQNAVDAITPFAISVTQGLESK